MQFTTSYAIYPKINLKARMKAYGWTIEDFAKPAVKNSANGALNPLAQHRRPLSIEQVVESRVVVDPRHALHVFFDFLRRRRGGRLLARYGEKVHRQKADPDRELHAPFKGLQAAQ